MMKILVVEDELSIRSFIALNLKRNEYEVVEVDAGEEALKIMEQNSNIHMALLDVMLAGELSGYELCVKLRKLHPQMGIIMLTAMGQEDDKLTGLYSGADDYMVKPFSPKELVARLDALKRRIQYLNSEKNSEEIVLNQFTLSLSKMKMYKDNNEIELTPTEFAIMKLFIEKHDLAISREELLNTVWGADYYGDVKVVDVNIRRMRSKIEEDPSKPQFIETIWGYGYCFKGAV